MNQAGRARTYRIFISRVSREFASLSESLASDLRSKGIVGHVQIDFRQEAGTETTLDKTEQYIRDADAVIAIVGRCSGAFPPAQAAAKWSHVLPDGVSAASYSQWEVHFARFYKKRLSFYFSHDHSKNETHFSSETLGPTEFNDPEGQSAYCNWLTQIIGIDRSYFSGDHHLCRQVLKEPWPVELMCGPAVTIHPSDLENLIQYFDANVDLFNEPANIGIEREFEALAFKEKNLLNNLSDTYFQSIIVEDSLPQFSTINAFLINPRNSEWRRRYKNVAMQFKSKYQTHRQEFGSFEQIFDDIFDRLQARGALVGRDSLIYIFLHYMYCTCDLGRRTSNHNKS